MSWLLYPPPEDDDCLLLEPTKQLEVWNFQFCPLDLLGGVRCWRLNSITMTSDLIFAMKSPSKS